MLLVPLSNDGHVVGGAKGGVHICHLSYWSDRDLPVRS